MRFLSFLARILRVVCVTGPTGYPYSISFVRSSESLSASTDIFRVTPRDVSAPRTSLLPFISIDDRSSAFARGTYARTHARSLAVAAPLGCPRTWTPVGPPGRSPPRRPVPGTGEILQFTIARTTTARRPVSPHTSRLSRGLSAASSDSSKRSVSTCSVTEKRKMAQFSNGRGRAHTRYAVVCVRAFVTVASSACFKMVDRYPEATGIFQSRARRDSRSWLGKIAGTFIFAIPKTESESNLKEK
ncbi:hypothetical protein PUN28_014842 [Cardiocondyla obscurior]|uniref:Secreted protein n=1 Tax=Cardiocondyla obscurior TaxID=286306 RepID=A0AAW2EZI6_9HYME